MYAKEEVIFTIIVVIFVLVFLAILFLVIVARNNARKNKLLFENEKIRKEFEQLLLNTRLEIQEQTLSHVSREIHDNIGQTLSLARLQLHAIDERETDDMDKLLEKAITDLRTLSHNLNTDLIREKGFVQSVHDLLLQFERTGKYSVRFSNNDFNADMSDEVGIILFRIIQEVLNNIVKHAQATHIDVNLNTQNSVSYIVIKDNGKGFDTHSVKSKGLGLESIKERVKIIGGTLDVMSGNKGTEIKIIL